MNRFLQHADEIFSTARQGAGDCEMAILVHADGTIHVVPGEGWATDLLRFHHGAEAVYRVTRSGQGVRVEARKSGECCELRSEWPPPPHANLCELPGYHVIS